jgi:NAD(P)-dependent dehydrogenase (short-subunit alcohol dehydrogenase family)
MLDNFSAYLANPQRHGTSQLHLASLVIAEADALAHPIGAVKTIPASLWLDSINSHVIYPISLIHTFLPLLTSANRTIENSQDTETVDSTVVIITQSNTSSLELPGHACESLSTAALSSYTRTLQAELPSSCRAVHIRLGAIDFEGARRDSKIPSPSLIRSSRRVAGQSLPSMHLARQTRELHLAAFDAIAGQSRDTVFVGPGARTYAVMGALAPRNLILWMVGERSGKGVLHKSWASLRRSSRSDGSSSESEIGRSLEWENVSSS